MKIVLLLTATGRGDAVNRYDGGIIGRKRVVDDVMTGILEWWNALLGRVAVPTGLIVLIGRGLPMARTSNCVDGLDAIACHSCDTFLLFGAKLLVGSTNFRYDLLVMILHGSNGANCRTHSLRMRDGHVDDVL